MRSKEGMKDAQVDYASKRDRITRLMKIEILDRKSKIIFLKIRDVIFPFNQIWRELNNNCRQTYI